MAASTDNPRGQQAIEVSTAFTALAALIVALRLYTRLFLVQCHGIEDYGIVVAMVCSIGLTVCIALQASWGMGKHAQDIESDTLQKSLQAFWASLIVYNLSLGLIKISILLQYRRVFTTKKFMMTCYVLMGFVTLYTIWAVFGGIFACLPVRAFWTREPAQCLNQFIMWFTNASVNIVLDFVLILLPIPVIRGLNLGRRQKIALISIFAVGGFVCIVSILRLQSLVAISNSNDPTYDNPPAAVWSSVETNVGIICSCLPLLRPLITRFLPGAMSSKHASNSTRQRRYASIGSTRGRRTRTRTADGLEMTKHSHASSEDRDIQVVTNISIQVDSDPKKGWTVGRSNEEWEEKPIGKGQSSTETLAKDVGRAV